MICIFYGPISHELGAFQLIFSLPLWEDRASYNCVFSATTGIFSNYDICENDHYNGKRYGLLKSIFRSKRQIPHWAGTDETEIAKEEEEKLGSKVYALNKSPSSVHSELDASLIIAILTLHTKDRIALNYICCTVHSR